MILDLHPEFNHIPDTIKKIYIMGICGTGMAALAGMLQDAGYEICGSDSHVYPPMSTFLADLKIKVFDGYSKDNIHPDVDLVIVGNVIRQINEEAQHLAKIKTPYLSFPQALSHFFINNKTSLVVAGTHGKTTTCSLLASALYHAKHDPTFMIGGIVREFDSNFRIGNGKYFIAEGDEYDTAFFDKESKFLHYQPHCTIITSLEFDHADIFADLKAIKKAFRKYVLLVPKDGCIIANSDDKNIIEILEGVSTPIIWYGKLSKDVGWNLGSYTVDNGITRFEAIKDGSIYGNFSVRLPGEHNALNSLAVIALLDHLGLKKELFSPGLEVFGGVKRRQEIRGIVNGITVIDDFAHHPTAVTETLKGLKLSYKNSRLIAVFEPRTNSSRRTIFQEQYSKAFKAADLVLVRSPEPIAGLPSEEHFSSETLVEKLRGEGKEAHHFPDASAIISFLAPQLKPSDVVAILSNGGFENIHSNILDELTKH